jgi:DNA-binding SARP family transcriptional activator
MELVKYKENNGHCNVPTKNGSLGKWVTSQRTFFRSKKLKADRYEKLVGIGFTFENARFETKSEREQWNKCFIELVKYKQKNGHCNVPTGPTTHGSFGYWISTQRSLFRSKKLKADRYEKLVGIGFAFSFTKSKHETWNILFVELVEYKQKNGHCNVPTSNGSFGNWVSKQRTLFRSKELEADRYEKLVGIGFA